MSEVKPVVHYRDYLDPQGNPDGGEVESLGINIQWHRGPITLTGPLDSLKPPNGAFVSTVIDVAIHRLQFYQSTKKFMCEENARAIENLNQARLALERDDLEGSVAHLVKAHEALTDRMLRRKNQGVLGTHVPDN